MLPRTLLHAFLLTTLACGDAPGDGDSGSSGDGGGSSSGGGDPTTGAEPQSVAELAACDEVDLQASGWMGPAFDPETGALRAPLEPPYVVATTVGWHTPGKTAGFEAHTEPVVMDVLTRDGLLGVNLATAAGCKSSRTLTVWRDEASLMLFVLGKVHKAAIASGSLPEALGWETTHWTETSAAAAPTWEQARQRLDEAR